MTLSYFASNQKMDVFKATDEIREVLNKKLSEPEKPSQLIDVFMKYGWGRIKKTEEELPDTHVNSNM